MDLRLPPTRRLLVLGTALALCRPDAAEAGAGRVRPGALPRTAAAQEAVPLDDFVEALAPLGDWYVHARWGRAWKPRNVGADWRPYQKGRWAHTEQGWYWVSEEPWGWATYHFGRWFVDALAGWTWIPGKHWAPSWVVWREGKGLVGWAPLGPDGKHLSPNFLFVPKDRLLDPVERAQLPVNRGGEALMVTRVLERKHPPAPPRPARRGPAPALAGG